jgi:hypothetical protein
MIPGLPEAAGEAGGFGRREQEQPQAQGGASQRPGSLLVTGAFRQCIWALEDHTIQCLVLEQVKGHWLTLAVAVLCCGVVSLQLLAVRCLCELLTWHPSFNFATNVLTATVKLALHRSDKIRHLACQALTALLRADDQGEVSDDDDDSIGHA